MYMFDEKKAPIKVVRIEIAPRKPPTSPRKVSTSVDCLTVVV
jgi:hypothetical protein